MAIEAGYFDGLTSRRQAVRLRADASALVVEGEEQSRREDADRIAISERLGGAPRTLSFADGAYCEVPEGPALDELLADLGHRQRAVARLQASWRIALLALAAVAVCLAAGYRWGLPWAADAIAPRLPPVLVASLSQSVLDLLDKQTLKPTRVSADRQHELDAGFRRLVASDPDLAGSRLLFRQGGAAGPNAFALPDGRVVLFDEVVDLADRDAEVMAVLAHELGHVKYRHGVRQLIQSSAVAFVVGTYFGDVSPLLSGLSSLMLQSKYSRDFESQADAFGALLLRRNGYSPEDLAIMLEKLEKAHDAGPAAQPGGDWLSSHPETAGRIARLRAADAGAGAL